MIIATYEHNRLWVLVMLNRLTKIAHEYNYRNVGHSQAIVVLTPNRLTEIVFLIIAT